MLGECLKVGRSAISCFCAEMHSERLSVVAREVNRTVLLAFIGIVLFEVGEPGFEVTLLLPELDRVFFDLLTNFR
jgi:hypothetical protein